MFTEITEIQQMGFTGFKTVQSLWNDHTVIPNKRGVYFIINPDCSKKSFLQKGVGGYFKGKDPNIPIHKLDSKWVDSCHVLYIGQAGGKGSSETLRGRIKKYLDFGKGKPVGHYGGRLIWQLSHHKDLIVAWKETIDSDPREQEKQLLVDFHQYYEKLPFANLVF